MELSDPVAVEQVLELSDEEARWALALEPPVFWAWWLEQGKKQ